jgi:hypothetical protein
LQWVYGYPVLDNLIKTPSGALDVRSFVATANKNFDKGYEAGWWKK